MPVEAVENMAFTAAGSRAMAVASTVSSMASDPSRLVFTPMSARVRTLPRPVTVAEVRAWSCDWSVRMERSPASVEFRSVVGATASCPCTSPMTAL